jgi:hypothetical protein
MATPMLTEEQTKNAIHELGCAAGTIDLHSTIFHWISVLIGESKRDDCNREVLLEIAHHLADDWDARARADGERFDRALAQAKNAGIQEAQA